MIIVMLSKGQRKTMGWKQAIKYFSTTNKTKGRKTLEQKISHQTNSTFFRMSVLKNDVNIIYETSDKLRGIHLKSSSTLRINF